VAVCAAAGALEKKPNRVVCFPVDLGWLGFLDVPGVSTGELALAMAMAELGCRAR